MSSEFNQYSVKYRPQSFEDVLGNASAVSRAQRVVDKRLHAVLIHGQSGCAKTTLAWLIAKARTSKPTDIEDINIGDKKGIDDVRGMVSRSGFLPRGETKVFLLDECHELLGQSQSAILKEIEHPKHDRVLWLLTTDRPHKLSVPLFNRCFKIEVERPDEQELAKFIYRVIRREKELTNYDDAQRKRIAVEIVRAAERVPREALQLLEQVCADGGDYSSFKELVVKGIRNRTDNGLDKTVLQVIAALYAPSKSKAVDDRAAYLVNQLADKDQWGLVTRLLFIHQELLNAAGGVVSHSAGYYRRELKDLDAVPNLQEAAWVGERLATLRNSLSTTSTTLPQTVVPALVNTLYALDERRTQGG